MSHHAAEDLAFACYLAIVGVNLAFIINAFLNSSLGVSLALVLAAKNPIVYLTTTVLGAAIVWLEIVPHPEEVRAFRRQLLSKNMSILGILILALWLGTSLIVPEGGLGGALSLLREGRFISLSALTLLVTGFVPQGFSYLPFLTRDIGRYSLLVMSPLLVYAIWRANLLGHYTSVVGGLILVAAWAFVIYDYKKRGA